MDITLYAISPDLGSLALLFTFQSEIGLKVCIVGFINEKQSEMTVEWFDSDPEIFLAKRDFFEIVQKSTFPSYESIIPASRGLWERYCQDPSIIEYQKRILEGGELRTEDYELMIENLVERTIDLAQDTPSQPNRKEDLR
jgi:hypothetical protein